jgi:flagellar biosynthesis/type III secretory pathway chaperone
MGDTPELLSTLEELLVKEFRACQSLHTLTRAERQALSQPLSSGDIHRLCGLVEEKEVLLDQLGQLEDERRMLVGEIAAQTGLRAEQPTLAELLEFLKVPEAGRISRLRDGILTLSANVREMTSGNLALAGTALERADAVQAFLLNLYRPPDGYLPPGAPARPAASLAWEVDHKM